MWGNTSITFVHTLTRGLTLEPRFIEMMQGLNLRSVRRFYLCLALWRFAAAILGGMDGWSQGDFYAGISLGYDLRLFLPLNISAFEVKDNKLKDWCVKVGWFQTIHHRWSLRTGSGRNTSLVFTSGSIASNEAASHVSSQTSV